MPLTLTALESFAKDPEKLVLEGDFQTGNFVSFRFSSAVSKDSFYKLLQCALANKIANTSEIVFDGNPKVLVITVMDVFKMPLIGSEYKGGFEINGLDDDAVKAFFARFPHHVDQLCLGYLTDNMWPIIESKLDEAAFTHVKLRLKENCSFTDAQKEYVERHNQARNELQITETPASMSDQATPSIEAATSTKKRKPETRIDYVQSQLIQNERKRARKEGATDTATTETATAERSDSPIISSSDSKSY